MHQSRQEFDSLLELYKELKPKRVLEIGVKYGGTLWHWIHYAPAGATVVAVDDCRQIDSSNYPFDTGDLDFHFIKGDSHSPEVIEQVNFLGPYDFVFIDGDHTYEGVIKDWNNYGAATVVAFHDIVPHEFEWDQGPSELWQEIKDKYKTKEFVSDWHGGFGGIGVVLQLPEYVL